MPRSVTTAFRNAITAGDVRPVLFFEALFDGGAVRFFTGIGEVSWNGFTWYGSGSMIGIEPIEEVSEAKSRGTRIALTGIDATIVTIALAEPYQGRVVRVYLALLNSSGAIIADPDILFSGRADVMQIEDNGSTATITLSVENMLIDLQRPRPRRYEPQDQKVYYPADKGFDYVPTLQDKTIKWE